MPKERKSRHYRRSNKTTGSPNSSHSSAASSSSDEEGGGSELTRQRPRDKKERERKERERRGDRGRERERRKRSRSRSKERPRHRSSSRDRWKKDRDRKRRRSRSRSRSAERNKERKHREKERSQIQTKSSSEKTETKEKESTEVIKKEEEPKKPKVVTVARIIATKKKDKEVSKGSVKESGEEGKEGIIAAVEAEQKRLEEEMQKRRERLEEWRKKRQKEEEEERAKMEEERKTAWTLEDDEDDDDEQNEEKMEIEGEQQKEEKEEDLDPLDAFMKGINQEAKKILGSGDDAGPDSKTKVITVTKVKGEQEKKGELMQNNQDAVEYSDEEQGDDELATALLSIARKNKKKDLPKVDHKSISYDAFRKNFYVEVPELAKMTQAEVTAYREELGSIKVKGKNCPKPVKSWAQCGLSSKVLDVIKKCTYDKPTPIQAQAIPAVMSGRDLIGIARTGSGKTLAFLLPLFRHILDQPELDYDDGPISLILSPTRELALQIYAECKKFCKPLKLRAVCVYGGTGISDQIADLKRGAEIVVCTPGRMIDMLAANNGKVTNMRRVTYVVLDEADRMFDMGFEPQVTRIISMIRPDRQTVMFSATFPRQMEALARKILTKPIEVQVGGRSVVCKDVDQSVIKIEESKKFFKLLELLGIYQSKGGVLVFVERQAAADNLVRDLMKAGYPCMALHGGMDQFDRDNTIADFKKGVTALLVATSVAARGLDVKELVLVVNYDCPNHYEDYVHRCGRTGRAGNKGNAYTFIMPSQQRYAGEIIKALELSGASVPSDVEEMWKVYQETMTGNKIEGKLKIKRRRAIGFTGKGFKFDEKEAAKDTEAKLKQKSALGLADSDDEDEFALLTMDKKLDELFSGKAKLIDPNAPQINIQKAPPPNAAASKSLAVASRIADKILMSKNIVAGGTTVTAAQEAASSVMKGEEVSVTGAVLASQIAASINAKVGASPAKAADAFLPVGTVIPKKGTDEDGDQPSGTSQEQMRYEEEIEINGFPQQIRFRVTTREVLDDVGEYAESYVSVRGLYIPPGQKPKEGEKRLHLKIEAKSERSVTLSKQEIKRVIKEEAQRMASRVGPKQKQGRYSVL